MEINLDFSLVLAVFAMELLFGVFYNLLIAWWIREKFLEGYASVAVAGGVLVTVGMTAIFSWQFALLVLGAFCFSGLPVGLGSIWRYVQARQRDQQAMRPPWLLTPNEMRKRWGLHPLDGADPEASEYHYKTDPNPEPIYKEES
jgi:hypothetical protein